MTLENKSVVVIGAGIGGLAAAVALSLRGAEVDVVELATALGEVGGGLQMGPNAMRVLDALGVSPDVLRPENVNLRDYRGGLVARLPMGQTALNRYGAPFCQVHRADLVRAFVDRAEQLDVRIRLGSEVSSISEDGELEIGTERQTADLVVAADGVRSIGRSQLFSGGEPTFTGQVAWRAVIEAARLPDGFLPNSTTIFMGPGRHLVTYPLRGGTLRNVVAVEERTEWAAEGWRAASSPEDLRTAFSGWCDPVDQIVNAVEDCYLWGLFTHPELESWSRGRVTLLGDACHPMLPFMAQGAGMALEDAWVLAACLDGAEQSAGLAAYEAKRKPRTTRMQTVSAGNAGLYHYRKPFLRQCLHLGMRIVSGLAPERMLGRFDWVYGEDVTDRTPKTTIC